MTIEIEVDLDPFVTYTDRDGNDWPAVIVDEDYTGTSTFYTLNVFTTSGALVERSVRKAEYRYAYGWYSPKTVDVPNGYFTPLVKTVRA